MKRNPELYLKFWSSYFVVITFPASIFFMMIYAIFFGGIFDYVGYRPPSLYTNILTIIIMFTVFFITVFRDIFITYLLKTHPIKLYNLSHNTVYYSPLISILGIMIMIFQFHYNLSIEDTIKLLTIPLMLVHITILFARSFSEEGDIRYSFENVILNINSYSLKQIWLKDVSAIVQKKLKDGYIDLSKESFIYYININNENTETLTTILEELKNALLNDEDILKIIKKFIKSTEISIYKKESFLFTVIRVFEENPKLVISVLLLILLIIIRPQEWYKFINEFFFSII